MLIAALVVLGALSEDLPLLPETPPDWRYERLDFPLTFAPELDWSGYEELRFAPGMFDPESETYFTYVLALRLEDALDVDAATVSHFLRSYYLGLTRSVAEGRGLDLDLSTFSVATEGEGQEYVATVEMYDPFVTGEALELHIELWVQPTAEGTEMLGLASPRPKEHAVWTQLRRFAESWREARPVPVFFNHLYLVPDAATYEAIRESEFLRDDFASFEERTTVRTDITYTGFYMYGERTYFEFLSVGQAGGPFGTGDTGLALGVETAGDTDRLAARLADESVRSFPGPVTRELDDVQVPWFRILGVTQAHAASRLNIFSLEYDPQFLESWHGDLSPSAPGITRAAILERYAAHLDQTDVRREGLVRDVTAIELALDDGERAHLWKLARAFGWTVTKGTGGWTIRGPGITVRVTSSDEPGGVTAFELALRRSVEREPLHLGRSTLSFDGATARWSFER